MLLCAVLYATLQVYEGAVLQAARLKPVDELEALFSAFSDIQPQD
jgi:hypothetical protein